MVRSAAAPRVSNHEVVTPAPKYGPTEEAVRSILRPQLLDLGIAGQIVRTLAVDRIDHDALAVLLRGLSDEGAERGLVIDFAEADFAEWRRHRDPFGSLDHFVDICRAVLGHYCRRRLDGLVAHDRAEPLIVVVLGLIFLQE